MEWFKEWFDSPYYHLLYGARNDHEAWLFIDNLLAYMRTPTNSTMLDLGCGKGRFAKYLAHKGFDVTGVDYSPQSIAFAKAFEQENLSFYTHDMRDVFRINYFDYVLNFFTSFGYFEKPKENERTLKNVYKNLKPNGVFIIDYFNSKYVLNNLVPNETKTICDVVFDISKKISGDFVVKDIKFTSEDKNYYFQERVRAFSERELVDLLLAAGFDVQTIFGNYQLQPFDADHSKRIIIIAKKAS
ncbi:MAG: methyltransferase domain-containing protein [Saprospiraceae bacterium]|nr:methyltransferase domain-containing protein [Saprospiraceae bacterium]MBP7699206.1 methyltransferase domain-containing protein [Saprospiraceae bacterium]